MQGNAFIEILLKFEICITYKPRLIDFFNVIS